MKYRNQKKLSNKALNISVVPKAKQKDEIVFNVVKKKVWNELGKPEIWINVTSDYLTGMTYLFRSKLEGYRTISTLISRHFDVILNTKRYEDIVDNLIGKVSWYLTNEGKWVSNKMNGQCIYGLSFDCIGNCLIIDERIGMKSLKEILKLFNIDLIVESEGTKITSIKAILN